MAKFFEPPMIWAGEAGGYRYAPSFNLNEERAPSDRFYITRLGGRCFSHTATYSPSVVERNSSVEAWKESPSDDLGVQSGRGY